MILFLAFLWEVGEHERGTGFYERPAVILGAYEDADRHPSEELEHVHRGEIIRRRHTSKAQRLGRL